MIDQCCIFVLDVIVLKGQNVGFEFEDESRGNMMAFSEDIKRIRRKAFLTQEDFAKEIGVSCITITRWETGKAKPNLKTMRLIDNYCKKNAIEFDVCDIVEDQDKNQ